MANGNITHEIYCITCQESIEEKEKDLSQRLEVEEDEEVKTNESIGTNAGTSNTKPVDQDVASIAQLEKLNGSSEV